MRILSASMDKTVILWEPDKESGVWLEQASASLSHNIYCIKSGFSALYVYWKKNKLYKMLGERGFFLLGREKLFFLQNTHSDTVLQVKLCLSKMIWCSIIFIASLLQYWGDSDNSFCSTVIHRIASQVLCSNTLCTQTEEEETTLKYL